MTKKTGEIIVPTEPVSRATRITGFTFKSYDKNAGVLQFEIQNQDGSPTDLLGATVRLFMYIYSGEEKKEFPIFDNQIITESYMKGIVKYPIPDMLLAYEGKVDANVYIDFPDGSHTDNLAFTFTVEKSIIDGNVQLNGEYYFKDFQQLLEGVQQEADEAVAKALEGLDQTISDAKADVDGFVQEATSTVNQTVDALNEELQTTQGQVAEVAQATDTIQTDLATIQEELTNAEEYFVKKETLEVGPLVFKNTQITTQDWNDIQDVGIYYCAGATGSNMPSKGPLYGYLTVKKISSVTQQTYETGIAVFIRSLTGNPQTWSNWHEIALVDKVVNLNDPQEIKGLKNFSEGLQVGGINPALEYAKGTVTDKYTNHGAIYLGGCTWLAWETLSLENAEGYTKGSYIQLGASGNASFTYSDVPNIFGGYLWLGGTCQPDYTDGGFGSYHITVENEFDDARQPIVRFIDSPSTPVKKLAVRGFALVFAPAPTENSKIEVETKTKN